MLEVALPDHLGATGAYRAHRRRSPQPPRSSDRDEETVVGNLGVCWSAPKRSRAPSRRTCSIRRERLFDGARRAGHERPVPQVRAIAARASEHRELSQRLAEFGLMPMFGFPCRCARSSPARRAARGPGRRAVLAALRAANVPSGCPGSPPVRKSRSTSGFHRSPRRGRSPPELRLCHSRRLAVRSHRLCRPARSLQEHRRRSRRCLPVLPDAGRRRLPRGSAGKALGFRSQAADGPLNWDAGCVLRVPNLPCALWDGSGPCPALDRVSHRDAQLRNLICASTDYELQT